MYGPTVLFSTLVVLGLGNGVLAHPAPIDWYHEPDSPIASLFVKRAPSPDDPSTLTVSTRYKAHRRLCIELPYGMGNPSSEFFA